MSMMLTFPYLAAMWTGSNQSLSRAVTSAPSEISNRTISDEKQAPTLSLCVFGSVCVCVRVWRDQPRRIIHGYSHRAHDGEGVSLKFSNIVLNMT